MDANTVNAKKVKLKDDIASSKQVIDYLYSSGVQSLLIEGGAEVLNHFIATGLWDEARIFTGKDNFNGGLKAPLFNGSLLSRRVFSGSILETYLNNPGNGTF
jgi:diaminohydroxyphosphoribosylaminopyrimidine deaminase/5-amino-6-(5-phosphoribosylamino)uracil reductase